MNQISSLVIRMQRRAHTSHHSDDPYDLPTMYMLDAFEKKVCEEIARQLSDDGERLPVTWEQADALASGLPPSRQQWLAAMPSVVADCIERLRIYASSAVEPLASTGVD